MNFVVPSPRMPTRETNYRKGQFMSARQRSRHRRASLTATRIRTLAVGTTVLGAAVALPSIATATSHSAAANRSSPAADPAANPFGQAAQPAVRPHPIPSATTAASTTTTTTAATTTPSPADSAVTAATHTTQPPAGPTEYRVRSGDTLSGIAAKYLGSSDRYPEIYALNRDRAEPGGRLTNPNVIEPGWTLALPSGASASNSASYSAHSVARTSPATGHSSTSQATQPGSGSLKSWIYQAISILNAHGYTVSYQAVYETAMHESSGDPNSVNRSDSNAAEGHPSIGLMQTIQPTFDEYALSGYGDIYNPVDNIIAAVRYAAANYGSLDDVVAERCGGSCWRGY